MDTRRMTAMNFMVSVSTIYYCGYGYGYGLRDKIIWCGGRFDVRIQLGGGILNDVIHLPPKSFDCHV